MTDQPDRAALRDCIALALEDAPYQPNMRRSVQLADAVLTPVLREVEQAVRAVAGNCGYKADDGCDFCNGVDAALEQVRRLANETPAGEEAATEPLLLWNEAAGVTYQEGRITLHVDQAVNLAQSVPAGSLILQPAAAETLRQALTRALTEAHAPRCPHCGESLADYDTDAYVYRAGDGRPYCSSKCVVAAYRAAGSQI